MRLTTCVFGLALAGLTAFSAYGQAFPTQNVTILVPFAAGGPTDVIMRILGERLTARWEGTAQSPSLHDSAFQGWPD